MSKPRGKSTTKSRDRGAKDKHEDESAKRGSALAFTVLQKDDSEELLSMSVQDIESKVKELFQLKPTTDLKDAAVLDYYVGAIYWGIQQKFTAQQLSGFFTVVHTLLLKIKDEALPLVEIVKDLKKMMVGIGTDLTSEQESGGLEFFSVDQAKAITDYLRSSLFQHFKLYEFMFTKPQWEEIIGSDLSVEVPPAADMPFPPPLDEGISEAIFKEFLTIPTPQLPDTTDDVKEESDQKPLTPVQFELPAEVEDLFAKLTPEDVRAIVQDVSTELLQNLQSNVDNKIRNQENAVLAKINKIHVVLPQPKESEEAAAN